MPSFKKRKTQRNDKVTLSFTDIGKSWLSREILTLQIWLFIATREKGSEFTVPIMTLLTH